MKSKIWILLFLLSCSKIEPNYEMGTCFRTNKDNEVHFDAVEIIGIHKDTYLLILMEDLNHIRFMNIKKFEESVKALKLTTKSCNTAKIYKE